MLRMNLLRAILIACVWTLLAAFGLYYTVRLYANLRPEMQELLPANARSVIDIDRAGKRMASIDSLSILVFSDDIQGSKRFVQDLAERLSQAPKDLVSGVESNIREDLAFFKKHRALYIELGDLKKIRRYIRDRVEYERDIRNPLNIFSGITIKVPSLDFESLRGKYESKVSAFADFPDGYYATQDQKIRAIQVYSAGKTTGVDPAKQIRALVDRTISDLNPRSYAPDLKVRFTGDIENLIEEHSALIADLETSTGIVIVLVTAVILWYFWQILPVVALLLSLFMATTVTFGIAYFTVGYVNANTAFLGSIVIGNGINYGIILLARYMESRRIAPVIPAIDSAIRGAFLGTLTASLAASVSYGSLVVTQFRGFHQFGVIGLIGMVICWISAFTLMPAFLFLFDTISPSRVRGAFRPWRWLAKAAGYLVGRRSGQVWWAAVGLTVVSLAMLFRFSPDLLEADLTRLRSKASMEHGSGYYAKYIDMIFKRYLSPIAILPSNRQQTDEIAAALKELKKREPLIADVRTIDDFLPPDQNRKMAVLEDIRRLLPRSLLVRIPAKDRELAEGLLDPANFTRVRVTDLPPTIRARFTEKDGTLGKMVLVEPPLGKQARDREQLIRFARNLRTTVDTIAPGTPIAGTLVLTADMLASVEVDGPKATLLAFLSVVALVIVLFRAPRDIVMALAALMIGVCWYAGVILGLDLKINFLNFIALPITFGIGVDYGVNVVQRYCQEGPGSIVEVVQSTGTAVVLASLTTIIGYSSLLVAQNRAFVSFGTLAVVGELVTVSAAMLILPAYLERRDRSRIMKSGKARKPEPEAIEKAA